MVAVLIAGVGASGAPVPAAAVVRCFGPCVAEIADPTVRGAGAIGLIGDSVLMGIDPWIASDLATAGWGPFHYWAGTGTRVPADNPLGAATVLRQWRAAGFDPPVWIIGVGADDVGFVGSSVAASEAEVELLLAEIGSGRDVVMATIQHHNALWEANWNQALRNVAARHPALHVVEWQAEADQHPSWSGGDGVHLSPAGYRVRSQRLVEATMPLQAAARLEPGPAPPVTASGAPSTFVPLATTRVLDTRATGARLAAGAERAVDLSGVVPNDASAAVVNLTVDGPAADGYLSAAPCGAGAGAGGSSLNYAAGRPRGAAATITLGPSARFCLTSYAVTDVIVDVAGAYVPGDAGSRFVPTAPTRLVDTRAGGRPGAAGVVVVTVPAGSSAATVNLTATGPAAPGFLTAYRCDQPRPVASNVNFGPGQTVANLAVVAVGAAGRLCVFTSSATDVVVDLLGAYGPSGLRYQPAAPLRLLDTRDGTGGWSGRPAAFQPLDVPAVPGAIALALTVATVAPDGDGFTTVYPCATAPPLASNLNTEAWSTATANAVVVASPACIVAQRRAHEVVDLSGWWLW